MVRDQSAQCGEARATALRLRGSHLIWIRIVSRPRAAAALFVLIAFCAGSANAQTNGKALGPTASGARLAGDIGLTILTERRFVLDGALLDCLLSDRDHNVSKAPSLATTITIRTIKS